MIFPDYNRSILSTTASILRHFGVNSLYPTLPEVDAALATGPKHVALVLADGAGVRPMENNLSEGAYLRRMRAATVTSVFPSTTTAAITAYYAGQSPLEHGWLGWSLYFKEYAADAVTFLRKTFYTGKDIDGPQPATALMPYESIFEKIRRGRPEVKTITQYAFPTYAEHGAEVNLRFSTLHQLCENIRNIAREPRPTFSISYWAEPDASMHQYGVSSAQARAQFRLLNDEVEALSRQITDTLLIVTADHGLIDGRFVELTDYPDITECLWMPPMVETRAAAFYVKPYRRVQFENAFRAHFGADFLLLSREEVLEKGLLGRGTPHRKIDDFIGDYLACATGSACMSYTLPGQKKTPMAAVHAGLTEDEMLVPVMLHRR